MIGALVREVPHMSLTDRSICGAARSGGLRMSHMTLVESGNRVIVNRPAAFEEWAAACLYGRRSSVR
jgi:hypothetical protein